MKLKQVIHFPDSNSVEATWVDAEDRQVKCHSYADVQMDMLRADLGDVADQYADLIAEVEANIKPTPPEPVVVPAVSPWQIRKALNQLGLRQAVETAVASAAQDIKDGWEFATTFNRADPLVVAMGQALGKNDAELDALFLLAATL